MRERPNITKKELLEQMSEIRDSDIVKKALKLATKAHKGQLRDTGISYLTEHVYYVTSLLYEEYKNDPRIVDLVSISLLHDVVEDGGIKISQIKDLFGEKIASTVELLSKNPKEEGQSITQDQKYIVTQNYLQRLSNDKEAVIVKLYDRIANINCILEDTVGLKPEKYHRYMQETKNLYIPLAKRYNFTKEVRKFENEIDRIEKLLGEI